MNIRIADVSDLPQVVSLALKFFGEFPENDESVEGALTLEGRPISPEIWRYLLRFVSSPECLAVVAEEDHILVGLFLVEMQVCPWTDTVFGLEQMLYIEPEFRDFSWFENGLALVDQWLKEHDATHLRVCAAKAKNNDALSELLSRHGFERAGHLLRRNYEQ